MNLMSRKTANDVIYYVISFYCIVLLQYSVIISRLKIEAWVTWNCEYLQPYFLTFSCIYIYIYLLHTKGWRIHSNVTFKPKFYARLQEASLIIRQLRKEAKMYLIIYEILLIKPFTYYIWWEISLLLTGESDQKKSISLC